MKDLKYVTSDERNPLIIDFGDGIKIGTEEPVLIAGPCAIEDLRQMEQVAKAIAKAGTHFIRGGAFKPRTSPYSFQGLGEEGLKIIRQVADQNGLKAVSEVMDTRDVDLVAHYVDMIQVGSRNMQNFALLKEIGKQQKPILLKRGMTATIEEWLSAAEYIAYEGNENIVLCERGVRSFDTITRNMLDLAAVPIIQSISRLPIIVDPSHGTGRRELIVPMTKAALAAGANGIMVEIHPVPDESVSDKEQALGIPEFENLVKIVRSR